MRYVASIHIHLSIAVMKTKGGNLYVDKKNNRRRINLSMLTMLSWLRQVEVIQCKQT